MRPGGGKQKGGSFERKVCVALSKWVSKGKRTDCFWRSAMSGGRATVRNAKGEKIESQRGDITAISEEGQNFINDTVVECKHVRDLNLARALTKGAGNLVKFWKQVCNDCRGTLKSPMLIAKQNNIPGTLLFMLYEDADTFRMHAYRKAIVYIGVHEVGVYLFKDFLRHARIP